MMIQTKKPAANPLMEIAERIREMREIVGYTEAEMAEKTEVSVEQYHSYEQGTVDFPFTFMHKCALASPCSSRAWRSGLRADPSAPRRTPARTCA